MCHTRHTECSGGHAHMQFEAAETALLAASAELHSVWVADPVHLPHIRALTRSWLTPLRLDTETESDIVLAVNEAASNAIEHAYVTPGPTDLVVVRLWTEPHHLRCEVTDHGRWKATDADPGHRGRGIPLMAEMIDSVVIQHDVDGTRVLMRHPINW
jgi:serine/threonine-protein kinase RsbW